MPSRASIQGYTILRDQFVNAGDGGSDINYPGGLVLPFIGAAALKLGEAVYISADNTVNKSAVAADHLAYLGVVVGGDLTKGECGGPSAAYNSLVVNDTGSNKGVLVQVFGVQSVICDAAIAVGPIAPSTTVAGRVRAATGLVIAAGAVAVTSSAANGAIITGDGFARIIGRLLVASGAAGDIRLALLR